MSRPLKAVGQPEKRKGNTPFLIKHVEQYEMSFKSNAKAVYETGNQSENNSQLAKKLASFVPSHVHIEFVAARYVHRWLFPLNCLHTQGQAMSRQHNTLKQLKASRGMKFWQPKAAKTELDSTTLVEVWR